MQRVDADQIKLSFARLKAAELGASDQAQAWSLLPTLTVTPAMAFSAADGHRSPTTKR